MTIRQPLGRDGDVTPESRPRPSGGRTRAEAPHAAFFVPSLDVGGAQRVTVTVANGLAARGYDVDLVLSYHRGGLCDAVADEVRVVDLETPEVPVVGVGAAAPALRSYLAREEPDVLFSVMTFATVVVLAAATSLDTGTDLVAAEHDTFGRDTTLKGRLVARVAARLYGTADHVLAVSEGVADSVVERTRVDPRRVSVQHNPVEVERIRREAREAVDHPWLDGDHEVVLSVGRLTPQKNHEMLLRAFPSVRERRDARLVVAGTGPERDDLLALAGALGIDDAVSLPGYVENAYGYMRRASVFALSSRHEGLPTVLIEALACGCPVVSTDCPSGPREILADGEYGRLVPVGDPDALSDALVATLDNPPAAAPLRERADDFAAPRAIEEYAAFVDARADRPAAERR